MSKFIADKSFFELFPNAKLGVLLIKNMQNNESPVEVRRMLVDANSEAEKYLVKNTLSENPVIAVWREAFKKFKTKKGARCSIEALLKRVDTGNIVGSINTLVDIYNTASLKFGLPCGAEDMDAFVGDLRLTITEGGDEFFAIGSDRNEETYPGELCYKDDEGAICRCFNWRDGQRTMIKDDTKNAFLIMEIVDDRIDDLKSALEFISENTKKYLNADVYLHMLDCENNEVEL